MKKNIMFVAAILALSTATYAAPDTKGKPVEVKTTVADTKAADVKTTDIKPVEVKVDPKAVEVKPVLDKSKLISNFTGTIEYKSDLFGTESGKNSGDRTYTLTETTGGTSTTTSVQGVTKTTEKSNSFLDLDKDDEENKVSVDLGAKIFDAYDIKLSLKALYDKDEQYTGPDLSAPNQMDDENYDPNKLTTFAQESTTFAISRTWADAYVEWKSNIDLNKNELFQALVKDSSLTVRKKIGKVEGQIKAGRVNDAYEQGKYGIDTTSSDTYIKVMPTPNLNVTFRPYDIDWQTGKEFKNNNLNRAGIYADVDSSTSIYSSEDLIESFNNHVPKVEFPLSGIEVDYTKGKVKYFGKLNAEVVKSKTVETVTLGTGVNDKDKVISKITDITTPRNVITTMLGADIKIGEKTKVTATTLFGNDKAGGNPENRTTETTTYTTPTAFTTSIAENKNEETRNYFAFNVFAETKVSKIKLEAEMDYRNDSDSRKTVTNNGVTNVSTNPELSRNMFGLFGKATFEGIKVVTPYVSTKYTRKAVELNKSGSTVTIANGNTVSSSDKFTESYDKLEFTVGAEKKYDALTLGTEFTVSNAGYSELKQSGSETTVAGTDTYDFTAEKVDLGVNTLASFKVSYKF